MQSDNSSNKHNKLAIATLVINVVYYVLPLIAVGLYVIAVKLFGVNPDNASELGKVIIVGFIFFAVGTLLGIVAIIMNSIYLAKVKPEGRLKVAAVISLNVCLIMSILAVYFTVMAMGFAGAAA